MSADTHAQRILDLASQQGLLARWKREAKT
jgi:hypothetical protein